MGKRTRLVSILSLTLLLSLSSVVLAQHRRARGRIQPGCRIVCLSGQDNGSSIELSTGAFVHLLLVTNWSTGYQWHVEELDDQVFRSLCYASIPQSPLIGSASDLKWFFEAVGPGETDLVLKYYRPWEGPASAVNSFSLHVVVH
jgi:predicted secreted protein